MWPIECQMTSFYAACRGATLAFAAVKPGMVVHGGLGCYAGYAPIECGSSLLAKKNCPRWREPCGTLNDHEHHPIKFKLVEYGCIKVQQKVFTCNGLWRTFFLLSLGICDDQRRRCPVAAPRSAFGRPAVPKKSNALGETISSWPSETV